MLCACISAGTIAIDYRDGALSGQAQVLATVFMLIAALCLDSTPIERVLGRFAEILLRKKSDP